MYLQAVELLCAMNWDLDGQGCYACLTAIVTHLLKMTLNADRESRICSYSVKKMYARIYLSYGMFETKCHYLELPEENNKGF